MKILLIGRKGDCLAASQLIKKWGHGVQEITLTGDGRIAGLPATNGCDLSFFIGNHDDLESEAVKTIEALFKDKQTNHMVITSLFPAAFSLELIEKMLEHLESCDKNPLCQQLAAKGR